MIDDFCDRIQAREARIGVIGLGYVGLPLVLEFAKNGFPVTGFDCDARKIEALHNGRSYIRHFEAADIQQLVTDNDSADATTDLSRISECDALLICVPTPLTKFRDPDLSYVVSTAESIAPHLRAGQLVVLESTTYPGTTEEVMVPALEGGSNLSAGHHFYVAYSPEREDPSNPNFSTASIPKVVGGLTPNCLRAAQTLYDAVICETVPVSTCRAAEATKLMENIFRCINIALVNELKVVFAEMNIDIWEVIEAAKTKPFGYMPFYPGPGLGGHCIPIDPFYLTWKAKEYDVATRFIELAGEINTSMPDYVVHQAMLALNDQGKALRGSRILLVGLAYKPNVDDDRESPTYVLWTKLAEHGAEVAYYDPYCSVVRPTREHSNLAGIESETLESIASGGFDAAIISTAHACVDHDSLAAMLPLVIDTRNACGDGENIRRA
jgi:UDP-N-acetyl-D-glucosamine dehydrogenase